jgi:oligoendopeptidase F
MDYKGYNIAVHEFGHNVEEVISLYDIDYYTLAGIPNTGFTEASAFLFQQRDMKLLGYGSNGAEANSNTTLDMIWGMYEIMGVSLVDMRMWQWLYQHPQATAAQLRDAVIKIAAEVWNQYYEPVLGEKDSPLLAIYSHMVGYALYLPGYPIGQIVQYQLEEHLAKCPTPEAFAKEYTRIYQQGRLTPDAWMRGAVGTPMSVQPILKAVREQLQKH